ncbi:MAG: hypothetical protein ACOY37_05565 [Pseudomonadota bacterium]
MTASRAGYASLIAALLALTGCPSAMSTVGSSDSSSERVEPDADMWPLRFKAHMFGAHCFGTQACRIVYRGMEHGSDDASPSIESYGRPLDKLLSAGRGPIPNFPAPAQVRWKSKDGSALEADVDIGEIFKDRVIRHRLGREEIPEATLRSDHVADIIIEVNDRTINVYTRALISTREQQKPGNRHSNFRNDLFKVFTRTY